MRKKRNEECGDESLITETADGFFMKQVAAAVESDEWGDFEIIVRCRGRKICRGFEVKAMSVTNRKI